MPVHYPEESVIPRPMTLNMLFVRPKANHKCLATVGLLSQGAAELFGGVSDPLGKGGRRYSSRYLVVTGG